MSVAGGTPIDTSLIQTAQAQQSASKARDKERAAADERAQRYLDQVELRVAGVESMEAVRPPPENESEQAAEERRARDHGRRRSGGGDEDERPHVDVTA